MIRQGGYTDLQAVFDLGMRLKRRTPYVTVPVDKEQAMKTLRQCISSKNGCIFIDEVSGEPAGVIVGIAEQLWYSSKRYATDLLLYSGAHRGGARLINAFLAWAWAHPAVVDVTMGVSSGLHSRTSHEWFVAQGFERVGGMYQMGRYDWAKRAVA